MYALESKTFHHILVDRLEDDVVLITLNRPDQLNAVNQELHDDLTTLYGILARQYTLGAVVITGAGRAFCAGGDLGLIEQGHTDWQMRSKQLAEAVLLVRDALTVRCPVIAAVNGPAVGLGATVALLADIVVMADSAWLSDPHTQVGLVAGDGGALLWPYLVGPSRAKEFLMLGTRIEASRAEQLGLVNHVVPAEETLSRAKEIASQLANGPREAIAGTKLAINAQLLRVAGENMPLSTSLEGQSWVVDDILEGVSSVREKRAANWPSARINHGD
jgi:enoyl-CoA hydratase